MSLSPLSPSHREYIGIDPGMDGAIALFSNWSEREGVYDLPSTGEGKERMLQARLLQNLLDPKGDGWDDVVCVIEHQRAIGKTLGVATAVRMGYAFGWCLCFAQLMGWRIHTVTPSVWKKKMGLQGKDKEASRAKALSLFPSLSDKLARKKDHNRAEALLLAEYARSLD